VTTASLEINPAARSADPQRRPQPFPLRVGAAWRRLANASWWHCHPVLLLTFIGAVLRLWKLDQPALWYDEAMTYARSAGTYIQMVGSLEDAGFSPLHYETYWALNKFFWMTPFMMRILPALCGIAMIPAMYMLARQFVRKPAAVAVAAFTTFSAFMLNYSRDAKMYMDLWLFCVLSTWCFLSFLRGGKYLAFLGWVAAGLAMVGLHALGCILLALPPLFLLTRKPPPLRIWILFVIGMLLIGSGPLGYYTDFSHFLTTSDDRSLNAASGTTWVPAYNAGRTGGDQVLYGTTSFLFSWEWPRPPIAGEFDFQQNAQTSRDMVLASHLRKTAAVGLLLLALAGMWPWKRAAHLSALHGPDAPPSNRVQSRLWLAVWLIVPAYGFYCASVRNFDTPTQWINSVSDLVGGHWWIIGAEALVVAIICSLWKPASRFFLGAIWLTPLVLLNIAILNTGFPAAGHFSDWFAASPSKWFAAVQNAFDLLSDPRTLGAALPIIAAVAFYQSDKNTLRRLGRTLAVGIVVAIMLGACQIVAQTVAKSNPTGSVWIPRYMGVAWPAFAIILCGLFDRLPHRTLAWSALALLVAVNLVHYMARFDATEPPIDRISADLIDSDTVRHDPIGQGPITHQLEESALARDDASITDADILLRNTLGDPMVIQQLVADDETVGNTQTWHKRVPIRTYLLNLPATGPNPGQGNIDTAVGHYYLAITGQTVRTPAQLRSQGGGQTFFDIWPVNTPAQVAADVRINPTLKTLIAWDYAIAIPHDPIDTIQLQLDKLKTGWQLQSTELFTVEDHWSWHSRGTYRRRVYTIIPPPTAETKPAGE
jgi:hypothetical protein